METATGSWTLGELANLLGGELRGPADLRIRRPVASQSGDPEGLAFAESEEYVRLAENSSVGAVIVPLEFTELAKPCIRVAQPRQVFARFLAMCERRLPFQPGIHPSAVVSPDADVDSTASIGAFVVIEGGAKVGADCVIYPFAYVGEGCQLAENVTLYPHAVLYQNVEVGQGSIVHAGAVLGADGFGFTWNGSEQMKIPQVGQTILGKNVEIGACATIDRATFGATVIGDGTKIDNQVQIAHNSRIGRHCVIAAQAGISGSTVFGDRCVLAGQTATVDHVKISDDVTLTGRTAVTKDIVGAGVYRGAPALPYSEQLRLEAAQRRLPDVLKRLRNLEIRLAKLEESS